MDLDPLVAALVGTTVGGGVSGLVVKFLFSQWIKAEAEFKEWARGEIKLLRDRFHEQSNLVTTQGLQLTVLSRQLDDVSKRLYDEHERGSKSLVEQSYLDKRLAVIEALDRGSGLKTRNPVKP